MKFEIVLTDPFVVDSKSEVFKLWLDCIPKDEAVERLLGAYLASSKWPDIARQHEAQLRVLINNDTTDQYRMFGVLERYLKQPLRLRTQHVCYLNSETQRVLIRNYYCLDQARVLDLIRLSRDRRGPGGKLAQLQRMSRSAAAASLRSASNNDLVAPLDRQLDNVHRVYAALLRAQAEAQAQAQAPETGRGGARSGPGPGPGPRAVGRGQGILRQIRDEFRLSADVAADYAHVIFLLHHNVSVLRRDGLREKAVVAWEGLKHIASAIMVTWCGVGGDSAAAGGGGGGVGRSSDSSGGSDSGGGSEGGGSGGDGGGGCAPAADADLGTFTPRRHTAAGSGCDGRLHLELRAAFCDRVVSVALFILDTLARSTKLTPGGKKRDSRKPLLRAKLKALHAARQQHVDRAVELVLKLATNLSKPKQCVPTLLLEFHKISETLAQAQVPGGTARFLSTLAEPIKLLDELKVPRSSPRAEDAAELPPPQANSTKLLRAATRPDREQHDTSDQAEWSAFLRVVEIGIGAVRRTAAVSHAD